MRLILILIIIYLMMQNPSIKSKVMDFIKNISRSASEHVAPLKEAAKSVTEKSSS